MSSALTWARRFPAASAAGRAERERADGGLELELAVAVLGGGARHHQRQIGQPPLGRCARVDRVRPGVGGLGRRAPHAELHALGKIEACGFLGRTEDWDRDHHDQRGGLGGRCRHLELGALLASEEHTVEGRYNREGEEGGGQQTGEHGPRHGRPQGGRRHGQRQRTGQGG